ncbi:MAG TPA: carboxypeptidase regulatory-like domain-containing protein [Edaphobacter sp.]|nr:carboxypeptidase regulatory-like domain-containing protein [Edaphobacter sp.]
MRILSSINLFCICCVAALTIGCSGKKNAEPAAGHAEQPTVSYFKVDAATAGSITGTIRYTGKKPARKLIDMSEDPACVEAHQGKAYDESLVVGPKGALANAFIYIKKGFEGKTFAVPATPVVIDQRGCWFRPRIVGIQTGQVLQVINSDPVTHNIHPMAEINREWNHSQGPGDPPMSRKFLKPEIMIPVKCNIHSWMHAYIGVVDNPYFAVSKEDGSFAIENLPPGTYTLGVWQEKLGTQEQQLTVAPHQNVVADFTFKGK